MQRDDPDRHQDKYHVLDLLYSDVFQIGSPYLWQWLEYFPKKEPLMKINEAMRHSKILMQSDGIVLPSVHKEHRGPCFPVRLY
jgi:hypothetical protein